MDARELAEKNKILQFRIGSHLYGTATETSDEDFAGIFMPDERRLFGFERIEQVDMSVKSKRADGKNDSDAVDMVLYDFRKFMKLALENNPNILEMLFVDQQNIIFQNEFGKMLLDNAHLFPYRGLKEKFLGYAISQKHKMIIRTDSFHALQNASDWLKDYTQNSKYLKQLLVEILHKKLPFFTVKGDNVQCGDLNFQKHFMLRKVKKMINDRLSKATNRKELLTKYGYDTKFASHLIRLLVEGQELLLTGKLEFPLLQAPFITDIKMGEWKMKAVLDYAEGLEQTIEKYAATSKLPAKPRYEEIQNLTVQMIKKYHNYK